MRAAPSFFALYPSPQSSKGIMSTNVGRSSDSRISLLPAPSPPGLPKKWLAAGFVPGHSGGTAPAFNGIPSEALYGTHIMT